MTSKDANWLFFTVILVHFGTVLFLLFAGDLIPFGIVTNFLVSEGILMVPALLFLLFSGELKRPVRREAAGFRRIKISTVLMIFLCTLLLMPLVTVLNALTMFFTDNAVASLQGDILNVPFPVMLFMIGIFGPFCEEFVFRGVMYKNYCRCNGGVGSGIPAVALSALTFGLMHMNFNQALYAFVLGIFLALLVEVAGSLWASVACHMFFNSFEVVLMYLSDSILGSDYEQALSDTMQTVTTQELVAALSVYLVIAAVTTPIAVCILVWIMKNEEREEAVRILFRGTPQRNSEPEHVLSIPLIVAVVLSLAYMSLEWFLMQ
ncbi:MAG: CPBP family intramembrane metalloprotease [Lachnospiraceae bacterium]|nr:CPBP family intramembrane metalloprotease [Lachnospiraceae bacterium]